MTDLEVGRYALRTFGAHAGRPDSMVSWAVGGGHWRNGVCEAKCLVSRAQAAGLTPALRVWQKLVKRRFTAVPSATPFQQALTPSPRDNIPSPPLRVNVEHYFPEHPAPQLDCCCGIYGSLSMGHLVRQYRVAAYLTAVIAAEGRTIIGTHGLRTERARVVAYYWNPTGLRIVCDSSPFGWDNNPLLTLPLELDQFFPAAERFRSQREMVNAFGLEWDATVDDGPSHDPFWLRGQRSA